MSFIPNTTPLPNKIINGWLPKLSGSQLKVLLIVVRQTLGWLEDQSTGRRKEKDWISHKQLRARTGLSTVPVSNAVDFLVKNLLIEVLDEDGNLLKTKSERRDVGRRRKKLFYRLATTLKSKVVEEKLPYKVRKNATLESKKDKRNLLDKIVYIYKQKINEDSLLTETAKKKIETRLKTFTEENLITAIDKFSKDSWWMEHNSGRGIAWFFHSDDRIDQLMNIKPRKGVKGGTHKKDFRKEDYTGGKYGKRVTKG